MKILFGVIILALSTFVGYLFSDKYAKRKIFYNSFFDFNNKLKTEITFGQSSVLDIISKSKNDDVFYGYIKNYYNNSNVENKFLSEEENSFVTNYLSGIGNSDKNTQLDFINKNEGYLTEKKDKSDTENKKYKSLFIKLGLLIGLIMFVIII